MKLRLKIIFALFATFLAAAFSTWMLSGQSMLQGFSELEDSRATTDTERITRAIGFAEAEFHNKSLDWAHWDDTYEFINDRNPGYLQSNMDVVSFKKIGIHYLLLIDNKLNLVHKTEVLSKESEPHPAAEQLVATFKKNDLFSNPNHGVKGYSGIVEIDNIPVLITLRTIHRTSGQGKSNGWLCFARVIDETFINEIKNVTRQSVSLSLIKGASDIPDWLKSSAAKNLVGITHIDANRTQGAAILRDMQGKQVLLVTVDMPRHDYRFGTSVVVSNMWHFALIGLLFAIVTVLVVELSVLKRLKILGEQVDKVDPGKVDSIGLRVKMDGSDELASLAFKINSMLSALDDHSHRLKESEELLKFQNEQLEATVVERTKEIEYQAFHDKLTGLANRELFLNELEAALKISDPVHRGTAVLFIDLDNFKLINDSLGHDVGDQFLVIIAERIKRDVRINDTVARLGGDEFTVVMTNLDSVEQASEVAERILHSLREPITLLGRDAFSGASIGISYTESSSTNSQMMLKNADTAMYRAKASGKMAVQVFDESMRDAVLERLELETALRKALDRGEIWVAYQPLVSLDGDFVVGAEALARWNHHIYGAVPPSEFIPIAEETGEILNIGYWVMDSACRQAKEWMAVSGLSEFSISINLSGKQLQRPDVVERVAAVLQSTGLPAKNLMLEITESILMEDRADIIDKMQELKKLGVKLALDDFGTGYSSLSTLRLFPIDSLKVDRSFISRIDKEEGALAIVEAIAAMAKSMKMNVTGEGVESPIQKDIIRKLGCANGQGFYYDRPLTSMEFKHRLRVNKKPAA